MPRSLLAALTTLGFLISPLMPLSLAPLPAALAEERESVAVLALRATGNLSAAEADLLTDRVRSLVVQRSGFRVLERESMDKILREQGFSATQDCENDACSVRLGRLLAVRRIITGSVGRVGSIYTLSLRIVDVEQGTILAEKYVDCNCGFETLLTEQTGPLLRQLLGEAPGPDQSPEIREPKPVRRQKPFFVGAEAGYSDYFGLALGYNFNEFLGLRLGVTRHQEQFYGNGIMDPAGIGAMAAARAYFNPHDLAGFAEIAATTELYFIPRLGLEYRNLWGLNLFATGGWRYKYVNGGFMDFMLGAGYAF